MRHLADESPHQPPLAVRRRPAVPFNLREPEHLVQVLLGETLFAATRDELRVQRRTMRQLVEWACKEFLARHSPERAAALGIRFDNQG